MSADYQQERLKTVGWVVGFIDGEGCFSVTIQRNSKLPLGWQVFPEFVVTQGGKSRNALEKIREFFECGNIFVNRRTDNHKENIYRYCVRSASDLNGKIIPFFRENPLQTAKRSDFNKFDHVLGLMLDRKHLDRYGLIKIATIAETMNSRKPSKFLKSSETIR